MSRSLYDDHFWSSLRYISLMTASFPGSLLSVRWHLCYHSRVAIMHQQLASWYQLYERYRVLVGTNGIHDAPICRCRLPDWKATSGPRDLHQWRIYDSPNMGVMTKRPRLLPKSLDALYRTSALPFLTSLMSGWVASSYHLVHLISSHNRLDYHTHQSQRWSVLCFVIRQVMVLTRAYPVVLLVSRAALALRVSSVLSSLFLSLFLSSAALWQEFGTQAGIRCTIRAMISTWIRWTVALSRWMCQ